MSSFGISVWPRWVWLWWKLLHLEAPFVAVIWQGFIARCYSLELHLVERWALGFTVWTIYLADRWIDSRSGSGPANRSQKEDSWARHRFLLMIGTLSAVSWAVVLGGISPVVLQAGLWLAAAVVCYLWAFAWRKGSAGPWKSLSAALLFTAGVFLVPCTRSRAPAQQLGLAALLYFALCLQNLMLIRKGYRSSGALEYATVLMLFFPSLHGFAGIRLYDAVALSAAFLVLIDHSGAKLSGPIRRTLADAALFTPLLFR